MTRHQIRASLLERKLCHSMTEKTGKIIKSDVTGSPRHMDELGRAADGLALLPKDVFYTLSGRLTLPFPHQKGEKHFSQWLIDSAVQEAEQRGDRFNARTFAGETPLRSGELPQASVDSMLLYLFGSQPPVVPGILQRLAPLGERKLVI